MQAAKGIKAPSLTVFLGNLDSKVTDRHLYELGCQAGPVQHVKVQHDSDTNKKGFGFITYGDLDSAIYCLGLYRGLLSLFGLPVNVNFANREVAADNITEEHKALLDKCKRMLVATGAEQHIPGAGPARRQQQSQRYTPYGAPQSRPARDKQAQRGAGGTSTAAAGGGAAGNGHGDRDRDYADAGKGYHAGDSSYQNRGNGYAGGYGNEQYGRAGSGDYGTAYAGGYGAAAGSSYAAAEQQQAPVPVADWMVRAAAAAAEAAARIEQPGASQYSAQGYKPVIQQPSYVQPPAPQPPPQQQQQYTYAQPQPPQQQQQQYTYAQPQPPQQQQVVAASLPAAGGYSTSNWGLHAQQQQQQPPAPAPVPQYQSSRLQAVTSQAYQPQLHQPQQPQVYAAAPTATQAADGVVLQQAQYTWQQQRQYQPALQQQAQQVMLQVAQQPGTVPQQVILQVPQQQQQQPPAGQIVYYY